MIDDDTTTDAAAVETECLLCDDERHRAGIPEHEPWAHWGTWPEVVVDRKLNDRELELFNEVVASNDGEVTAALVSNFCSAHGVSILWREDDHPPVVSIGVTADGVLIVLTCASSECAQFSATRPLLLAHPDLTAEVVVGAMIEWAFDAMTRHRNAAH